MTPEGWRRTTYGQAMTETEDRAGDNTTLPVLSVTKTRGPMLASERFGKVMHSRDLGKYRVAWRGSVVADPMLLWDGSIGVQAVVDAGLVSPDYRVYKPAPEVDAEFLGYLVRSPLMLPHYQGGARGTNVRRNRIARSDFLAIPILQPPIAEQRKIAAILSSVDAAIESTQAVIDQLGVVKKAMMAELLTRGLPGRHTRFKSTEIGQVPEEWEVGPLAAYLREPIRNGYSPVCPTTPTGRWILHLGAVTFEGFNSEALKPAPLDDLRIDGALVEPGDLLMSRANTRERVGLVGVYRGTPERVAYPDLMMRLRVGPRLLADFLELVLLSNRSRAYFSGAARGTSESMVKINRDIVGALVLQVPRLDEQREIVAAIDAVRGRRDAEVAALNALRLLKSALMSVLLTGEMRVKPDEEAA